MAPGTESISVIHFSLQPLIENAFIHGLERITGQGLLEVSAAKTGDELMISIRDNGVGMDEETLLALQHRLSQPSDTLDQEHIGIKNVHDRIQFYYGESYGIEVQSHIGTGTTITVRMPANNVSP